MSNPPIVARATADRRIICYGVRRTTRLAGRPGHEVRDGYSRPADGTAGTEARDSRFARSRATLLAPHVRYPVHNHAPEEVYLVLSDSWFQHGEGVWFEPGIGGTFYNTPHIKHAMASGAAPLFAIWCLAGAK